MSRAANTVASASMQTQMSSPCDTAGRADPAAIPVSTTPATAAVATVAEIRCETCRKPPARPAAEAGACASVSAWLGEMIRPPDTPTVSWVTVSAIPIWPAGTQPITAAVAAAAVAAAARGWSSSSRGCSRGRPSAATSNWPCGMPASPTAANG